MLAAAIATTLTLAQGGFDGPGRYEIMNLQSGKALDLDRNNQTTVIQFSSRGTDNQRWDIQPAGGGFYYFRNGMNGKALEPAGNSNSTPLVCNPFNRNPNQQWRIDVGRDGNAMIVSRGGKAIDIPNGSSRDGERAQIYDPNGDPNQRFILRRAGRGPAVSRDDADRDDGRDRRPAEVERNREPDRTGRFWDERDQMWKVVGDGACFYQAPDFRGNALCTRAGADIGDVSRDFSFSSVKLFGRARVVEVFERSGFRGERFRIVRDEPDLSRTSIGSRVGSFRVN